MTKIACLFAFIFSVDAGQTFAALVLLYIILFKEFKD